MVIVQGILGGLRVTGRLTLSASPEDTAPNLILAMIHGVFGQVFFATLVSIAVFTLRPGEIPGMLFEHSSARTERIMAIFLVALTVVQIAPRYPAPYRTGGNGTHRRCGIRCRIGRRLWIRAWGLYAGQSLLQKIGSSLIGIVSFQLLLGLLALWATNVERTFKQFRRRWMWFSPPFIRQPRGCIGRVGCVVVVGISFIEIPLIVSTGSLNHR
jgi:heme A synthase